MANGQFASVLRHIRQLMGPNTSDELTDGQLLERFALRREEAAFEALMERHGAMVHNLCRSILHDPHSADDAYQATFLVLARKATSIQKRQSVASWLYGVAYRISLRAKASAARRRLHERQTTDMPITQMPGDPAQQEMRSLIHQELNQLPEKYRAPLVLCYLEGKTNEIAARELGWPSGSMSKRLARARDLLRDRLSGRGVALSAVGLAAAFGEGASAAVPPALMKSTLQAAVLYGAGQTAAGGSATVQAIELADGMLRVLGIQKSKAVAAVCLLIGVLGGGAAVLSSPFFAKAPINSSNPEQAIVLPEDQQAEVVSFELHGGFPAPEGKEPYLTIHGNGLAVFGNPYRDSRKLEMRLSQAELQELLRFVVQDQDFFGCDSVALASALRGEAARKGYPPGVKDLPTAIIQIQAAGREHEVTCPGLSEALARHFTDVRALARLRAIQQRLERLVLVMHAGGPQGLADAVRAANEQLRRQFPEAPTLTALDLQSARLHGDNRAELVLERRGVAADRDPFSFVHAKVDRSANGELAVTVRASLTSSQRAAGGAEKLYLEPINVNPPDISTDPSVNYNFDIVYVRTPRKGDQERSYWSDVLRPGLTDPGADLMLLHPDRSEELLVPGGADGAIADPAVSLDGQWVYYAQIYNIKAENLKSPYRFHQGGSDIFKIHVKTRTIVRLTHQEYTPNTGVFEKPLPDGRGSSLNLGPCPLPGGRVMFVSNRNALQPAKHRTPTLQLFVMDEDGSNVECIAPMNLSMALHPVVLMDGRVMFSLQSAQGLRNQHLWSLWTIHPDGTNAEPLIRAFGVDQGQATFHLQTQLSDGSVVAQQANHKQTFGFGTYLKLPPYPPEGLAGFGPASINDPRNPPLRYGRWPDGRALVHQLPFSPYGIEALTPFASHDNRPAGPSVLQDPNSPAVGRVTHPAAAPDNHLLTVWSPGPVSNREKPSYPMPDGGIYLLKSGKPIDAPGEMLLIKNDPNYNEMWPRAVVPYHRIHGMVEPKRLPVFANDGKRSPHLPEGGPFGLLGAASLYKRESYPGGVVLPGKVTAGFAGPADKTGGYRGLDPFNTGENGASTNWFGQGADAGRYNNDQIHAIRIVAIEPTTDRGPRLFYSHSRERLRILGEIPVRKFSPDSKRSEPLDPDGNPDTSFLVKLPADVPFTFQTIDEDGMVLNMAQTWHQLRPGEVRTCGGCHAPSQKPTLFERTAAGKPDYVPFDLTGKTLLLTRSEKDQTGKKWDRDGCTGVRYEQGPKIVEYYRDIQPIFQRSCVACHSGKSANPSAGLVLDDNQPMNVPNFGPTVPGTYYRLAADRDDNGPRFGPKPFIPGGAWRQANASRYIRMFQSRRSLLVWKILGRRTDGWNNEDFPHAMVADDPSTLVQNGKPVPDTVENRNRSHLIYNGKPMPPPEAVKGETVGADGQKVKVESLSDEDRRTIIRWIDLGCPIDLDYKPADPKAMGYGYMLDDQRPTVTLNFPRPGVNEPLKRLLIGTYDYESGLDLTTFRVVADFPLAGVPAGENLAPRFRPKSPGVWELPLANPLTELSKGRLTVSVRDRQGNETRIDRIFSVTRR